ncbi:hypothetical protein GY45DRAFT_1369766 [Cubamyces sp. BRFM 1775]|nr:hypothetical protein GY45DRAFT_1369766 [Cubamyces sp. BRFM 1775]
MADSLAQEYQEIISDVYYFTVDNICEVAGIALLAYDYLLTFSGEIQFVWSRKFSGATVVFVLNRYVTLFSKIVLPISTFWWPNQTDKVRREALAGMDRSDFYFRTPVLVTEIFTVAVAFVVAAFSALRVYAVWNKDWRIFVLVFAVAMVVPVTNMYHYIQSIPSALPWPIYGCGEASYLDETQWWRREYQSTLWLSPLIHLSLTVSIVTHTCAIGADLLVIVLTWIKTYQMKKEASVLGSGAAFSSLIFRDGTLYFGTMLILNVAHLVVLQSTDTLDPLPIFVDVFTSILISRFMLNLRQVAGRGSDDLSSASMIQGTSRFSSVRFAADIVGDLGAPLEYRGLGDPTSADNNDVSELFTGSSSAESQTEVIGDSLSIVTRHSTPPTPVSRA